jgi:hypothetical protein
MVVKALLLAVVGLALFGWIGLAEAQPGPAPVLKISTAAKQAILSWPTNASGFVLETATSLAEPVTWAPTTNAFSVSGSNLIFTVPGPTATVFYRLHWINSAPSPIVAPAQTWTWVTFTNAYCMGGTPLGIGVNLNTNTDNLLIFLTGGGACWSELTCYQLNTATQGPFGQPEFDNTVPLLNQALIFNRASATNPFKDYSYVYVPYCTGDVHGGSHVSLYGTNVTMHVGYLDMAAYLARLVPTFPGVKHIVLAGSSAGGFGAAINWMQTQQAFGNVRVDLIDDSGPVLPEDVQAMGNGVFLPTGQAFTNWNINAALPAGCATCPTNTESLYGYIATAAPAHRVALLSYVQDSVIPNYYALSTSQFITGLNSLAASEFVPYTNAAYYFVSGSGHTFLLGSGSVSVNGVTLEQFITEMVTDAPTWTSEHP